MNKRALSSPPGLKPVKNAVLVAWALIGFAILVLVARSNASTARTLSFAEISKSAEIIADVTVQNVESYWEAPAGVRAIHTKVTFAINRAVKGNPGQTLTLRFLGGKVAGSAVRVPGLPEFTAGERYILFSAAPDKTLICPVLGLDQGAMRVIHDNASNADRVYRSWGQPVSASEKFETRVPVVPGVTTRDYLRSADTVERFVERVRETVNQ